MTGPGPQPALRGRGRECEALDRLVASVRGGQSRVLVVRGEAGVGKTALLAYVAERAAGCRVARATGVESEMELAYAGLHQLCAPFVEPLTQLPGPQAQALGTAFGLQDGVAPDRFLVGLAALTLLSEVADERPLVCLIDDAQWLDRASAQAFAFVARRLEAESVALVFSVRDPGTDQELSGLPELVLEGLFDDDARALLESVITGPLDDRVRDRIVAETRGNPLALLELPRGLSPEEMAGGFGLSAAPAVSSRIEENFLRRVSVLPAPTRTLLLVAAAEPVGDPVLVLRAADRLGIAAAAAVAGAAAGLVELGGRVRFRHPLVRSAVYRAASPQERQRVHQALAEATDPEVDPDRRAWHRGQATAELDEDVAAELERSAGRAQARGGLAAGAAFEERAAELTPEPTLRARRALAAAESKHRSGGPQAALRLLAMAQTGPLDAVDQARAELLRARIAFATTRGREAPALLLKAAQRLEPLDAMLARETYLDAFSAALTAGSLARGGGVRAIAEAALAERRAGSPQRTERAWDRALEGLAVLATHGYAEGAAGLKRALSAFRAEPMSDDQALRWLWLGCLLARTLADETSWDELSDRQVRLARNAGALSLLPMALAERSAYTLLSGDLAAARDLAAEQDAVIQATGAPRSLDRAVWLAAWRGNEAEAVAAIDTRRREVLLSGQGQWLLTTEGITAMLFNGLGRYEDALNAVERAAGHPLDIGFATWVLCELIEAAARSGNADRAEAPLRRLAAIARACNTDWALGLAARCAALTSEGDAAERLYREATDRLGRTPMRSALARAHLLYGEWLRRQNRRVDAREQLRTAYAMLTEMGTEAFAERARRELLATGETVRKRSVETLDELTAQERQIARLAADGRTNPEIGAQLFLSPRTVEWHLRKVFTKLGIGSRKQLRRALSEVDAAAVPA